MVRAIALAVLCVTIIMVLRNCNSADSSLSNAIEASARVIQNVMAALDYIEWFIAELSKPDRGGKIFEKELEEKTQLLSNINKTLDFRLLSTDIIKRLPSWWLALLFNLNMKLCHLFILIMNLNPAKHQRNMLGMRLCDGNDKRCAKTLIQKLKADSQTVAHIVMRFTWEITKPLNEICDINTYSYDGNLLSKLNNMVPPPQSYMQLEHPNDAPNNEFLEQVEEKPYAVRYADKTQRDHDHGQIISTESNMVYKSESNKLESSIFAHQIDEVVPKDNKEIIETLRQDNKEIIDTLRQMVHVLKELENRIRTSPDCRSISSQKRVPPYETNNAIAMKLNQRSETSRSGPYRCESRDSSVIGDDSCRDYQSRESSVGGGSCEDHFSCPSSVAKGDSFRGFNKQYYDDRCSVVQSEDASELVQLRRGILLQNEMSSSSQSQFNQQESSDSRSFDAESSKLEGTADGSIKIPSEDYVASEQIQSSEEMLYDLEKALNQASPLFSSMNHGGASSIISSVLPIHDNTSYSSYYRTGSSYYNEPTKKKSKQFRRRPRNRRRLLTNDDDKSLKLKKSTNSGSNQSLKVKKPLLTDENHTNRIASYCFIACLAGILSSFLLRAAVYKVIRIRRLRART